MNATTEQYEIDPRSPAPAERDRVRLPWADPVLDALIVFRADDYTLVDGVTPSRLRYRLPPGTPMQVLRLAVPEPEDPSKVIVTCECHGEWMRPGMLTWITRSTHGSLGWTALRRRHSATYVDRPAPPLPEPPDPTAVVVACPCGEWRWENLQDLGPRWLLGRGLAECHRWSTLVRDHPDLTVTPRPAPPLPEPPDPESVVVACPCGEWAQCGMTTRPLWLWLLVDSAHPNGCRTWKQVTAQHPDLTVTVLPPKRPEPSTGDRLREEWAVPEDPPGVLTHGVGYFRGEAVDFEHYSGLPANPSVVEPDPRPEWTHTPGVVALDKDGDVCWRHMDADIWKCPALDASEWVSYAEMCLPLTQLLTAEQHEQSWRSSLMTATFQAALRPSLWAEHEWTGEQP